MKRFNIDGTVDGSFANGTTDAQMSAIALQSDGKIIIAGQFTTINGISRYHIARLNTNGSVDMTFDP